MVLRELGPDVTAHNHDALVMTAATQIDLALDIDDAVFAEVCTTGYTRRLAKHYVAKAEDAQSVHLPDNGAFRIDEDSPVLDHLPEVFVGQVMPKEALLKRSIDMDGTDPLRVFLARVVFRLLDELFDIREAGRHLVLVGDDSRRVFDNSGDSAAVEVSQMAILAAPRYERGVGLHMLFGTVNLVVEVGLDLEYLPEVLIVR